jgi:transposase-like protein
MVARYHKTAPGLASWLEENIPEALEVFAFPAAHRKRLRTNNGLERLNKEIKRLQKTIADLKARPVAKKPSKQKRAADKPKKSRGGKQNTHGSRPVKQQS